MLGIIMALVLNIHTYAGHGNAGAYWQSPRSADTCLIVEVRGEPGIAGNGVLGLRGGDCS